MERRNRVSQQLTQAINDHGREKNLRIRDKTQFSLLYSDTVLTANYSDKMLFLYMYTQETTYFLATFHESKQTTTKAQQHGSIQSSNTRLCNPKDKSSFHVNSILDFTCPTGKKKMVSFTYNL